MRRLPINEARLLNILISTFNSFFNTFDNSITKRVVYYDREIINATRTIVKENNCKKNILVLY